ncbi:VWA domain-containing protein [Candidatus Micrarchaeota archaeon]|nr:VWA domain-containing protein [Candidatus Micrarchaeota archaeon]
MNSINTRKGLETKPASIKKSRGLAFTLDAVLAIIIIVALIPIFTLLSTKQDASQVGAQYLHLESEDTIDVLSKMQIKYIRNEPVIDDLFRRGVLDDSDLNSTVVDVLGGLWASQNPNDLADAANLSDQLISPLLPSGVKWSFKIENDLIFNTSAVNGTPLIASSKKSASGFAKNQSSTGYVARAFLENIVGKEDSSYFFFGGFVGNGQITGTIRDIPINSTIARIYLELNARSNFSFYLNGIMCQNMVVNFSSFGAENWTISNSSCLNNFVPGGINNISLNFTSVNLSQNYIGGGFLRAVYSTTDFVYEPSPKYYFPGTSGAINVYDSIYVIGNITNISAYLHYKTALQTFFTLGNATIFENNANDSAIAYSVNLDDAFILNALQSNGLSLSDLSGTTVPIRLGHRESNFSLGTGLADAFVVTAQSASMSSCDILNGSLLSCGANGNTTRFAAALNSDSILASALLALGVGNRLGNIGYHNNAPHAASYQDLTTSLATVLTAINNLNPTGNSKRCYACAIDEARRRLIPSSSSVPSGALQPTGVGSNYTKIRSIVMMGDGNADFCDNSDKLVGNYIQNCGTANAKKQAIDQACAMNQSPYSVGGNNITIYTIGYGSDSDDATLSSIANCTGGKFYKSSNYSELADIYSQIADIISKSVTYIQQSVIVEGYESELYPDSYIAFGYIPSVPNPGYKEISINTLTDPFPGCLGNFSINKILYLTDAKLLSYSGDYWTYSVKANSSNTNGFESAFNLSNWGLSFISLGDPYKVYLPLSMLKVNQTNYVLETVASNSSSTSASCSNKNRVIYSGRLRASTFYSSVFPNIQGRNVTVYYDSNGDGVWDGLTYVAMGTDLPNFDPNPVLVGDLNPSGNAIDYSFLELLAQLNYIINPGASGLPGSSTNPIDLIIGNEIGVQSDLLSIVPIPWGPSEMSISIWV